MGPLLLAAEPESALTTPGLIGIVMAVLGTGMAITGAWYAARRAKRAELDAKRTEAEVLARAESRAKDCELEAERRASERREKSDRAVEASNATLKEVQERTSALQASIEQRLDKLTQRETRLDDREASLDAARAAVSADAAATQAMTERAKARLDEVAQLTRAQARDQVLAEVRLDAESEAQALTHRVVQEAHAKARDEAREITLHAIQRFAGETVSENTLRTVKIASDDLKGRLIGREGRNIRALERATGADILIDDTPGVIAVSSFDKVRQTIAAEALQKLLADGRIHPTRIEEVVEATRKEIDERILRSGSEAAMEANVRGLHQRVLEALGRLSFRTSYGQNVLRHSIEVAFFSQIIADQLGLNGELARRCGLLHDIGKAMDHEVTGTHPAIGAEFLQRHGEKSDAVINAAAGHHGDIPSTSPYTPIVMAADALSGARPGARRDSMEQYVKRLQQLEAIAMEHTGVQEAFAIQAGREVRVIIDASQSDDAAAFAIAGRIAKRVEEEMTFPGEIKVTVLREVRAEAVAR
ncbi:MAG: ribonuclease Y [Planctomycetota bacterium]|nr:ribonuclease Y [Planctomycetota bacterium]MDA1106670.1 ribonuclease Y [Planctomycetota bacterium]